MTNFVRFKKTTGLCQFWQKDEKVAAS